MVGLSKDAQLICESECMIFGCIKFGPGYTKLKESQEKCFFLKHFFKYIGGFKVL